MATIINDPLLAAELIAQRQATGADRYDEVWEGEYMMAPLANNEHQDLVTGIATVLRIVVQWADLGRVYSGVNVSDQREDWTQNYRCPDVVVFLNGTKAENRDTHWFGGPDFAVEIISPNDRTRKKLDFYAKVNTRELLLVDRDPWALELYRLAGGKLEQVGKSTLDASMSLNSEAVPMSWKLIPGEQRPGIEMTHELDQKKVDDLDGDCARLLPQMVPCRQSMNKG